MAGNNAPVFPFPGGTAGAEPPDPVAGKPGHFAWSRWIKQFVKNLNTELMTHEDLTAGVHGIADTSALVLTSDARLADTRDPKLHAAKHAAAGSDPVTLAQSQVTDLTTDLAAKAPLGSWIEPTCDRTGATDAGAAINAAIAEASAAGAGVYLRAGVYKITTAIVPVTGTRLRGDGAGLTILRPSGQVCAVRAIASAGAPLNDVAITDLEIDGSDQTNAYYSGEFTKGIFMQYLRRVTFANLYIHHTGATGLGVDHLTGTIHNVTAENCGRLNNGTEPGGSGIGIGVGALSSAWEPLTISDCHANSNARYGIFTETQNSAHPAGIAIVGCSAYGNKDGIGLAGGGGVKVVGCSARANTRSGVAVDGGTFAPGVPSPNAIVSGCDIVANAVGILLTPDGTPDHITGPLVADNSVRSNTGAGVKVVLKALDSGLYIQRITLRGNHVSSNGSHGIHIDNTAAVTAAIRRVRLEGNRIWNNTGSGVYVGGPSSRLTLVGNETWDDQTVATQTHGVRFSTATDGTAATADLVVADNDLIGCATPFTPPAVAARSGTYTVARNLGLGDLSVTHPGTQDVLVTAYDSGTAAAQTLAYDTGWRDITVSAGSGNGTLASLRVRRVGEAVHFRLDWTSSTTGEIVIATFPAGFRPALASTAYLTAIDSANGTAPRLVYITSAGSMSIKGAQAVRYVLTGMFASDDAAPVTLPGTLVSAAPA